MNFLKALGFAVVFGTHATFAGAETPVSNATLVKNFDIIAFGNEYTKRRYDAVRRWKRPVRIGINAKGYPTYLDTFIEDVAADLNAITGHPVSLYYSYQKQKAKSLPQDFDRLKVNVFIFYLQRNEIPKDLAKHWTGGKRRLKELLANATCVANYFTKGPEIRGALVVIPANLPESFHYACVVEELTQIMGLPNDSTDVSPSIFNDKSRYFELTEHDKWLLRILYRAGLEPGTPRKQALEKARAYLALKRPAP